MKAADHLAAALDWHRKQPAATEVRALDANVRLVWHVHLPWKCTPDIDPEYGRLQPEQGMAINVRESLPFRPPCYHEPPTQPNSREGI